MKQNNGACNNACINFEYNRNRDKQKQHQSYNKWMISNPFKEYKRKQNG